MALDGPASGLRGFLRRVQADELPDTAAGMAYYFMLSLFPALILLVGLLDALPLEAPVGRVVARISEAMPGPAGELVKQYVEEFATRRPSALLSLLGIMVLWAASRGIAGARRSLNKVFGMTERRSHLRLRLVSVFMTAAMFLFIGVAYALLVAGPRFGQWLVDWAGAGVEFSAVWRIVRLPLAVSLLLVFVMLSYRYLPYRRLPFRYLLAGAVPAVAGWIALGFGFRLWLANFGSYDEVYGSLASVIVLLVFLWGVSFFLLVGAEVAAFTTELRRPHHRPPGP